MKTNWSYRWSCYGLLLFASLPNKFGIRAKSLKHEFSETSDTVGFKWFQRISLNQSFSNLRRKVLSSYIFGLWLSHMILKFSQNFRRQPSISPHVLGIRLSCSETGLELLKTAGKIYYWQPLHNFCCLCFIYTFPAEFRVYSELHCFLCCSPELHPPLSPPAQAAAQGPCEILHGVGSPMWEEGFWYTHYWVMNNSL